MSFPADVLSSFNNNDDDDRSRKSNWRCMGEEKMSRKLVPPSPILSSHIKCLACVDVCVCIYDRSITERKWRNKTPLFFFSVSIR